MKLHKNNNSNNIQQFSLAIKSSWENQFHFSINRRGEENQSKSGNPKNKNEKICRDDKFHNDDDGAESAIMMIMMVLLLLLLLAEWLHDDAIFVDCSLRAVGRSERAWHGKRK